MFITCLPSLTTAGREENFESIKTSLDIFLATSLPSAIAIEQSASFNARVSLTPSPVIATTWPFDLRVFISVYFCSGETLPKTVNFSANCSTSFRLLFSRDIYLSKFSTPTLWAIFETVKGSSPDIILIWTLFSLNQFIVSIASVLMWSSITINASKSFPVAPFSSWYSSSDSTSAKTRYPSCIFSSKSFLCFSLSLHPVKDGAPR